MTETTNREEMLVEIPESIKDKFNGLYYISQKDVNLYFVFLNEILNIIKINFDEYKVIKYTNKIQTHILDGILNDSMNYILSFDKTSPNYNKEFEGIFEKITSEELKKSIDDELSNITMFLNIGNLLNFIEYSLNLIKEFMDVMLKHEIPTEDILIRHLLNTITLELNNKIVNELIQPRELVKTELGINSEENEKIEEGDNNGHQ